MIDIKEIQMIDRGCAAHTAPDDRKECIQYKITDKTLPGFVIAEDPLSVGKTSAEIHRLFQWLKNTRLAPYHVKDAR